MATENQIVEAESTLGLGPLPADYRAWCLANDGLEGWFGEIYLALFPLVDVVEVSRIFDVDRFPGLVAIGSDGAGETVALDLRRPKPAVVLVNNVSAGWHEGLRQAESFTEFMTQRTSGQDFNWTDTYHPSL